MTLVAIHQPTFLPWLGWWDKLVRADVFVLLDDVQFPKKGGTWTNRVRMLVNGEPTWVTVPVDRAFHGLRSIRETRIDDRRRWRDKLAKTIATSYGRAAFFDDVNPFVAELLHRPAEGIAELNEAAIRVLAEHLGLDDTKLIRQSELDARGAGTDLLISLCNATGGTAYLTGDGAGEYLEREKFALTGLELVEQQFTLRRYPQLARAFVPGLSVVDALMNCGWQGTAALLSA